MIHLSLKQVCDITAGTTAANTTVTFAGISTDTRTLQPENLYIALKGEHFDGHDFLSEAKAKGAAAALIMQPISCDLPCVVVKDTVMALGQTAKAWRDQFDLPLIAVTGSNGKTTTKNMLQAIFIEANAQQSHAVLATTGNMNNHIGLPLMLSQLNAQHRVAIVEMGMNHFGEIHYLTMLAQPTVALITNAGHAHLAGVGGTIDGVAKAKGEIYDGLKPHGIAVINADDVFANQWREMVGNKKIITFGIKNPANVKGEFGNDGFYISYENEKVLIELPLLGQHQLSNALAASAASIAVGVNLQIIKNALKKIRSMPGRMMQRQGIHGAIIIDDAYNANPLSVRAAITYLSTQPNTKIVVLGDMRELDEQGDILHAEIGAFAKASGIDFLFAIGELSRNTVKHFGDHAFHFESHESLIKALKKYLSPKTTVLIKGSLSMKMSKIVETVVKKTI